MEAPEVLLVLSVDLHFVYGMFIGLCNVMLRTSSFSMNQGELISPDFVFRILMPHSEKRVCRILFIVYSWLDSDMVELTSYYNMNINAVVDKMTLLEIGFYELWG
ncbi:hypothetical protein NPIL_366731 [Nephila pilipes]|uniref:Uncharacterized protein n=1 Tax=Nephila pilipes TaxID=299642 RepID=A0A8X6QHS3_NEPPI|nr:hypothetical protein NPIL_366731 [Nephila pilipes]